MQFLPRRSHLSSWSEMEEQKQLLELKIRQKTDPRATLSVPELVRHYGYDADVHAVTTEDGYILELHRVLLPGQSSCRHTPPAATEGGCQPVFLQHGLLGSSSAWVMNEPDTALAYVLAEEGFDVWMGNSRGNNYSLKHTTLDVTSWDYWDFSFEEMGKYDLPAAIDYILNVTQRSQVHYIGHSMGTTMFWVMANERPDCLGKVASMSALGPAAYVSNIESPVRLLAPFNRELAWVLLDILEEYRLLNPNFVIMKMTREECSKYKFAEIVCSNLIFTLIGFDPSDLDLTWLPVVLGQLNAGGSTKTLIHFAQLVKSGKFQKFDFGSDNMRHYNQSTPPDYSVSSIAIPVLLKWGQNDWLADPKDVHRLFSEMNAANVVSSPVDNERFNHLDFLWGKDSKVQVYDHVTEFIRNHS